MDLKDNDTKVTYHHGMRTIGGTYIEVEHNGYRIYFDFGSVFNPKISMEGNFLEKAIKNDLIPELNGVYDRNITGQLNEDYSKKAVFISHIHLDHTQMINFVDKEIPVYMSNDTNNLLEALNINGEFITNNPNFEGTRKLNGVNYDDIVKIGEISVKLIRVDHDGYGACGFIINTPDVKIAYTGDIRFHGYLEKETLNFIEEAKDSDLLIIEGVSVSFDEKLNDTSDYNKKVYDSEIKLLESLDSMINENLNNPIFFNYYETNIERVIKLIEIAKKYDKVVVLDAYYANIIKSLLNLDVYYYQTGDNSYNINSDYNIDINSIGDNKYIFQLPIENFELLNFVPNNSIYLHIDATPLGEFDISFESFLNKIKKYFNNIFILKCSGHAHPKDLYRIIDEIKPKVLTPIHSFKPEMLYNEYGNRILPDRKQTIKWRKHEKI